MSRLLRLAILLTACSPGGGAARDDTTRAPSAVQAPPSVPVPDARGTGGSATAKVPCPPTGLWTVCAVVERLERAGLVPVRDSSATATEPPLAARGFLLRLGAAELEVYLYDDARARRRDVARVDTTRYLGYTEAVSMQQLPTFIQTANLVGVLHSRNDHQRERIGDALTAGPPQPAAPRAPTQLPPTSTSPRTP